MVLCENCRGSKQKGGMSKHDNNNDPHLVGHLDETSDVEFKVWALAAKENGCWKLALPSFSDFLLKESNKAAQKHRELNFAQQQEQQQQQQQICSSKRLPHRIDMQKCLPKEAFEKF